MTGRLAGKTALVTGAARGLGEAIVELFAEEGANVVFGDLRDELGGQVETRLRERGLPVTYTHLDVTSEADWAAAVQLAQTTYGGLTTLVSNAAINNAAGLTDVTLEAWAKVLEINLTGELLGMRAVIEPLRASGNGAIVNVASLYANIGSPSSIAYHDSKGGVRSMTKSAALEYAQQGVRINSLHPGMIDTEFGGSEVTEETLQEILGVIPIRRKGTPREIAQGAVFLASDESSYMIGAELIIDGGWSVP